MALPPILGNLPIIKQFIANKAETSTPKESPANQTSNPQDIVQLSEAARLRLNDVQELSANNPDQVRETAQEVAEDLRENNVALGLRGDFS